MSERLKRRVIRSMLAMALMTTLSSCKFRMDEFFVLQKAPPSLETVLELQDGAE